MHKKLIAIVPAAGIGTRAVDADSTLADGGCALLGAVSPARPLPKQYRMLNGEPMLRWAVKALLADERIAQVRVAVAAHDQWAAQALTGLPRTVWRPCGGPSRAETVTAALLDAGLDDDDWVLVHDAARPGLPLQALRRLIDNCLDLGVGGLLAQPVADTVKQAQESTAMCASVGRSVARERLWLAQTPQMFQAGRLQQALLMAGASNAVLTDEASAMELAGYSPCLIPGSVRNFKVTWPEDFELMEKWL
ncbi:2-C-methyl-D-erythritol 4-phosphate cytidylyltransferase [Pollutimonas bauzanensis]|uniref:IspD/TarI family cytidylyltransferase n=1 Tax=Pollutimonas bauzanensis TaxID=658167 RepID=UPI00333E4482